MKKLSISILVLLAMSCNADSRVQLDNSLAACLALQPGNVQETENLLLYKTTWQLKDNIGNCGCKSAALSYSVYTVKHERLVSHGVISSLNKSQVVFVLSSDNSIYKDAQYKLQISCAN